MAFPAESSISPVSIADLEIALFDPKPNSGVTQKATVSVQVVMSDGSVRARQFNLADHVSGATITQLQALAATLRTKANDEILP